MEKYRGWCKFVLFLFVLSWIFSGCGKSDTKKVSPEEARIRELEKKPVLYSSEVLSCNPDDELIKDHLSVFYDVMDRLLYHKKTADYIPDKVLAYTEKRKKYAKKPVEVTIQLGDWVEVLEIKKNRANETFCLVRTSYNTYAWLADWHLTDEEGNRLNTFRQ